MATRPGMARLITRLRGMTHAGNADVTINGTTYFTDEQLQDLLDLTVRHHRDIELIPVPEIESGTIAYYQYAIPAELPYAFEELGFDSGWEIFDAAGVLMDDYEINYDAGRVRFPTDRAGRMYFLNCRTYNLHHAAAAVWQQKAAFVSPDVDWQSDNHRVDGSTVFDHCLRMAALHARLAGTTVARLRRSDEA